jgi:trehalose/maltose hydrolase-like predicted phosphorylase
VSKDHPHLLALEASVTPEDWSGPLEIRSLLDGRVQNRGVARYRSLRGDHLVPLSTTEVDRETVALEVETGGSHLRIAQAARTRVRRGQEDLDPGRRLLQEPGTIGHELQLTLEEGVSVRVEKVAMLYCSRDHAISDPLTSAVTWIRRAGDFESLLDRHASHWGRDWERSDLRLEGEGSGWAQRVVRLHLFHLLQTVSENTIDLDVGVPASCSSSPSSTCTCRC